MSPCLHALGKQASNQPFIHTVGRLPPRITLSLLRGRHKFQKGITLSGNPTQLSPPPSNNFARRSNAPTSATTIRVMRRDTPKPSSTWGGGQSCEGGRDGDLGRRHERICVMQRCCWCLMELANAMQCTLGCPPVVSLALSFASWCWSG